MIKIHSANKSIESKVLFKNIDFELENKKITGLLGANGAGKTSLFRAIAGLSKIDSGKITFFEKNVTSINLEKRSNLGLSYVPQENSLFEDLTLEDVINIPLMRWEVMDTLNHTVVSKKQLKVLIMTVR